MKNENHQSITHHPYFWGFVIGVFVLLSVAVAGPLVFRAYADMSSAHDEAIQVKNTAITQAIIDRDYNTWNSLVTDPKIKAGVNSANFDQFAEAYVLLQQGRLEEADVYKKQVGLKVAQRVSVEKSNAIREALADNNYNAWSNIVGPVIASQVPSEKFDTYAESVLLLDAGFVSRASKTQVNIGMREGYGYTSSSHE